MKHPVRNWLYLLLIIGAVLTIDQISKRLVVDNLLLYESHQPIPALSPYFQITRIENSGASFGFLPQAGDLFLIIAVVVTIVLLRYYPSLPDGARLMRVAMGLVAGGAIGNALDRLQYGMVVDFIHYQIPGLISNVSNLADHAIVLGVGLVLIDTLRGGGLDVAESDEGEMAEEDAVKP